MCGIYCIDWILFSSVVFDVLLPWPPLHLLHPFHHTPYLLPHTSIVNRARIFIAFILVYYHSILCFCGCVSVFFSFMLFFLICHLNAHHTHLLHFPFLLCFFFFVCSCPLFFAPFDFHYGVFSLLMLVSRSFPRPAAVYVRLCFFFFSLLLVFRLQLFPVA